MNTEIKYLPVTLLSSYLYCPRKVFLEKVLFLKEKPKVTLLLGHIKHDIHDKFNKVEEDLVVSLKKDSTRQAVLKSYNKKYLQISKEVLLKNRNELSSFGFSLSEAFKKIWFVFKAESSIKAENVFKFMTKTSLIGSSLWEKLQPKILSEYKISSEKYKLRGIIDQVLIYPDRIIPLELKSGSTPKETPWNNHKIQLASYLLIVSDFLKKEINTGFIKYIDANSNFKVTLNPFLKQKVLNTIDLVFNLLNSKTPPQRVSHIKKCESCGLKDVCYNDDKINELILLKTNQNQKI